MKQCSSFRREGYWHVKGEVGVDAIRVTRYECLF